MTRLDGFLADMRFEDSPGVSRLLAIIEAQRAELDRLKCPVLVHPAWCDAAKTAACIGTAVLPCNCSGNAAIARRFDAGEL